ncbi:DUF1878 family protein [Cytobacillus sp. IB215665]|uniref:DUF1878 family protein n=1 Tax=Cytobacillus sp. IB215665 TaxID=3097357 RepID=UPI002A10FC4C|nr:DUF1878 family protein [Cytobacillus sp. IB215665]MDX8364618.1 DUF1878 family protein [Cytobacillus sp. IB215665]
MDEFIARIEKIEYYQTLLLKMVEKDHMPFYQMVIKEQLSKADVDEILSVCEKLSMKLEEQKAEGLLVFTPLLIEFSKTIQFKMNVKDTVTAMLKQQMYTPLMEEFMKLIK